MASIFLPRKCIVLVYLMIMTIVEEAELISTTCKPNEDFRLEPAAQQECLPLCGDTFIQTFKSLCHLQQKRGNDKRTGILTT